MYESLEKAAFSARKKSYSPYSHFAVGAAVLDENGFIHEGCNIENAAYTGSHAEYSAISNMINGGGKKIKAIAICGGEKDIATPCGGCRQHISEFADSDTDVIMISANGSKMTMKLGELLPMTFSKKNL